jgi:hypothetical protein
MKNRSDAGSGDLDSLFAALLRHRRGQGGLSQAEVAAMMVEAGYRWYPQTVHRIEHGERKATVGEALTLASRLAFSLADLNVLCMACWGNPPEGFTCNKCGRSGQ